MNAVFALLSETAQQKLVKKNQPDFVSPMLATLTSDYFSKPTWIYERKWDGFRIIAIKKGDNITLLTRNKKDYTAQYPHIVAALRKQKAENIILDGEVVAFKNQLSSFSLLKKEPLINTDTVLVRYCIFDILYWDGYDLTKLELLDRKQLLEQAIEFQDPLLHTDYSTGDGLELLKKACALNWEGIIAKLATSTYVTKRSPNWFKFKCHKQQEFVIIGYTQSNNTMNIFGALLLGYYDKNHLYYAGKVGTGFDDALHATLGGLLQLLEGPMLDVINFENAPGEIVHWIKPKLVAQIKFAEWTVYGKLRHASFLGLRDDKDPKSVTKERPIPNNLG